MPATEDGVSRFTGRKVHFIGIGGCGMSGLASMLVDAGAIVTGSEPKPGTAALALMRRGVPIAREQDGHGVSADVDLVVRTAAIKDDNAEFAFARRLGLKHMKYAQLLGLVMQERLGVAVAGTHGKSTTTAMTAFVLTRCGLDPSFVVGGTVPQLGGGSRSGKGEAFVVEACEYDRSFHNLHPSIALITNIEADHLDCYKDLDDIIAAFRQFAQRVPPGGLLIVNGDDPNVASAIAGTSARVQTVGVNGPHTWNAVPTHRQSGCCCAELQYEGKPVAQLALSVPGLHNLFDAAMAVAAAVACGASPQQAAAAVGEFTGVERRMMPVGSFRGALFVDDYGHHPTEIKVTLEALRERYEPRRLVVVFQPHQHSRTLSLLPQFAGAFSNADLVLVPDIYASRDTEEIRQAIHSRQLVQLLQENGRNAQYAPDFDWIKLQLKQTVSPGDLVLTIGAGNVFEIGRDLIESDRPVPQAV
jgi:UDP-N-acetylmuramate--alanine ligase